MAVLVGSLRRGSINRKFAESIGKLAADRLRFHFIEIGDLPLYNDDLWENPPESVLRLKREIAAADGVVFVTPEYNRSFSAAIKNAIDWGSRPWGQNSWEAKPAAIMGASPGVIGAAVAQNQLKSVLTVCAMVLMGQPEIYFSYKPELFDEANNVRSEDVKKFLNGWVDRFSAWIERTVETCTPRWHRSYSDHDPQKCCVAGTDRDDSDDGSFGVGVRLQLAQSAAGLRSSGHALLFADLCVWRIQRNGVLFRVP